MNAVANSGYSAVNSLFSTQEDWMEYGTGGGPLPNCNSDNDVEVPEVEFQPSEHQLQQLQEDIDPLSDDGNHGINIYMAAVLLMKN